MNPPKRLQELAQTLKQGGRVNSMRIRRFLELFGASRRGANKVREIRAILDELGLKTDPDDFESPWIDEYIRIKLKDAPDEPQANPDIEQNCEDSFTFNDSVETELRTVEIPADAPPCEDTAVTVEESSQLPPSTSITTFEDPAYRIGSLAAANKAVVSTNPNATLQSAITLMRSHDYSQLPVLQGEHTVKGMISWKSIAAKLLAGAPCATVSDCLDEAIILEWHRTLFEAIPRIVDAGYALVRGKDNRISGVITSSDLTLKFRELTEPFFLIREVELHLRGVLEGKLQDADFEILADKQASKEIAKDLTELSFGDYLRLLQHPNIWPRLGLHEDKAILTALLEEVRVIRNDVMHFDPDPLGEKEMSALRRALRLMQHNYDLIPRKT